MYSKEWGIGEIRVDISFINNTEWSERKEKEKRKRRRRDGMILYQGSTFLM